MGLPEDCNCVLEMTQCPYHDYISRSVEPEPWEHNLQSVDGGQVEVMVRGLWDGEVLSTNVATMLVLMLRWLGCRRRIECGLALWNVQEVRGR